MNSGESMTSYVRPETHTLHWDEIEQIPDAFRYSARRDPNGGYMLEVVAHSSLRAAREERDRNQREYKQMSEVVLMLYQAMQDHHKYVVTDRHDDNADEWCKANLKHNYTILLNHREMGMLVVFDSEHDAVLFKLFFG